MAPLKIGVLGEVPAPVQPTAAPTDPEGPTMARDSALPEGRAATPERALPANPPPERELPLSASPDEVPQPDGVMGVVVLREGPR